MELSPGESVIFSGRPSWRSILGFYFFGLVIAAAIGVGVGFAADLGVGVAAGVAVFLVVVAAGWLKRAFTKYTITTRRLRVRRGVLSRQVQETRLDRLQDHSIRQSLMERILRVGTVDFDTAADEQGDLFRFEGVDHPEAIILSIDRAIQQTGAGVPPAPADPR
ncbi:MAG: PH domain-containing protein [Actinobacteria bacterium]|nr:PH domain-containing protein [Actinomycetota bacterium]